jgi:O-glycosyl hydrolase
MSGAVSRRKAAAQRFVGFCATGSLLLAALTPQAALAQQTAAASPPAVPAPGQCRAAVQIGLKSEWATPRTVFKGWGTSLAWFASTTGTWPDSVRTKMADLLFGEQGLALNIARYNIGGGRKPGTPPLSRANANIPGMWKMPKGAKGNDWWNPDNPDMWDWSADEGQQWWLSAVKARVPQDRLLIEAKAYSPPWFMTVSGDVAGAKEKYQPNLRPGFEAKFAEYLVRSMQGLEKIHGIQFTSLSPLNEPNTPYWVSGNRQEGNFFDPAGQSRMLLATAEALKAHGSKALLTAMDETNPATFVINWAGYTPQARAIVQKLNVHSYSTTGLTGVRDVATVSKLPLWMSEVDLSAALTVQDFTDPTSALALGEQIVLDLKRLEPEAWVIWQAIEPSALPGDPGSNWGLLRTDMSVKRPADMSFHITAKYYAMASFSRHLRPGYRLVRNNDEDTITALSPNGRRAVVIHVNHGVYARKLDLSTDGLDGAKWKVAAQLVDEQSVTPACGTDALSVVAPPRAITAVVLDRVPD